MPSYKSKTTLALHALRAKLQAGEVAPGQRFDIRSIAAELNMSITPVREALRILQADGLVSYNEHRSISPMQLDPNDALELYLLRSQLESLAARLAASRWENVDEDSIKAAHEEMVAAAASGDTARAAEANRVWHFAVYHAAHTRFIEPTIARFWAHVAWSETWRVPGRLQASVSEHAAITEALLARRSDDVERLMRQHLAGGQQAVIETGATV